MHKPSAVLVDVDGTLVDVTGIRHLVEGENRDFNAFHKASIDCQPNFPVLHRVQEHHDVFMQSKGRPSVGDRVTHPESGYGVVTSLQEILKISKTRVTNVGIRS